MYKALAGSHHQTTAVEHCTICPVAGLMWLTAEFHTDDELRLRQLYQTTDEEESSKQHKSEDGCSSEVSIGARTKALFVIAQLIMLSGIKIGLGKKQLRSQQ